MLQMFDGCRGWLGREFIIRGPRVRVGNDDTRRCATNFCESRVESFNNSEEYRCLFGMCP